MAPKQVFLSTLVVLGTIAGALLAYRLVSLIVILLIAFIFASALAPAVSRLNRWMPLPLAILMLYALVLLIFGALFALIIPPLARQIASFINSLPGLLGIVQTRFLQLMDRFDIPTSALTPDLLGGYSQLLNRAPALAAGVLNVTFGFLSSLAGGVVVLVIAAYWLLERRNIEGAWLGLVPGVRRAEARQIIEEIESKLGGYVRGQLTLGVIVGLMVYVALLGLKLPFPLVLALIAGVSEMIPLIGPFIGAAPAVLLALSVSPSKALLVAGVYLLIQQLENNLLVPKVMQRSVGLNPLTVLVSVLAGGLLLGVVGALLAVPTASAVKVVLDHTVFRERHEQFV
jgi:predicted PurR-regulated permease PerM